MKKIISFMLLVAIMSIAAISFAHSGGTDSNGGHYDHSTGQYHYHNNKYR